MRHKNALNRSMEVRKTGGPQQIYAKTYFSRKFTRQIHPSFGGHLEWDWCPEIITNQF